MPEILQTPEGWSYLEGDTHLGPWMTQAHRIDHDYGTVGIVLPYVIPGSVVVEVGASIGTWTIPLLRAVGPRGKLIAFEPFAEIYQCLERNVTKELNSLGRDREVFLSEAAIGVGPVRLNKIIGNYGASFVEPCSSEGDCKVARLDDLCSSLNKGERISFIKIDCEGAELDVLRSGKELIAKHQPVMFIEINAHTLIRRGLIPADLISEIHSMGYDVFPQPPSALAAGMVQYDVLCKPKVMDAQIFICTWAQDLNWLKYALLSIRKYWKSSYPPFILATQDCHGRIPIEAEQIGALVRYEGQWGDHHLGQQYEKLIADTRVCARYILFMDSDCLFTRNSCAADFASQDGRPFIHGELYEGLLKTANASDLPCFKAYRENVNRLSGFYPDYEYVRLQPFMFHADSLTRFRDFVHARNPGRHLGIVMTDYFSWHFSEFNQLGAWCHRFEPELYDFIVIDDPEIGRQPSARMRQFHSWSQTPESMWQEVSTILEP